MPIIDSRQALPAFIYFPHEFMRGAILRALKAGYGDESAGWWLGVGHDGIARLDIGDRDHHLRWDGETLAVKGDVHAETGELGDLTIDGVLTIGAEGGLYQGDGDFAAPGTGLRLWNQDGIGRLAGFCEGVLQAGFEAGGAITWAEGKGRLDAAGLVFGPDRDAEVSLGDHEEKTPLLIRLEAQGESPWVYLLDLQAAVDQDHIAGLLVNIAGGPDTQVLGASAGIQAHHGAALKAGVLPLSQSGDLWSLHLSGAPVYGGDQRYTALGDAAEDADALNRRTADARYLRAGDSIVIGDAGSLLGVFGAAPAAKQAVAALVDNSAGAVDGELASLPDPLDGPVDAQALRDDLAGNLLPALRDNFADLAARLNDIQAALHAYGWV